MAVAHELTKQPFILNTPNQTYRHPPSPSGTRQTLQKKLKSKTRIFTTLAPMLELYGPAYGTLRCASLQHSRVLESINIHRKKRISKKRIVQIRKASKGILSQAIMRRRLQQGMTSWVTGPLRAPNTRPWLRCPVSRSETPCAML